MDTVLLKRLTGGDPVSYHPIREAARRIRPTAHLWVQGNLSDDARLGIGEDDNNAAAIRDRAELLWRERISDTDTEDKSLLLLGEDRDAPGAQEFRAAALARIVQYCRGFHAKGWPEVLPSLATPHARANPPPGGRPPENRRPSHEARHTAGMDNHGPPATSPPISPANFTRRKRP